MRSVLLCRPTPTPTMEREQSERSEIPFRSALSGRFPSPVLYFFPRHVSTTVLPLARRERVDAETEREERTRAEKKRERLETLSPSSSFLSLLLLFVDPAFPLSFLRLRIGESGQSTRGAEHGSERGGREQQQQQQQQHTSEERKSQCLSALEDSLERLLSLSLSPLFSSLPSLSLSSLTDALEHGLARDVAADDGEDVARVELGHPRAWKARGVHFFFVVDGRKTAKGEVEKKSGERRRESVRV